MIPEPPTVDLIPPPKETHGQADS